MTRISLQTLEQVLSAQQRAQQAGQPGGALSRLNPGEIIQAQVLRALGSGLFELSLAGAKVVTSSRTPLSAGQTLTLQFSGGGEGQPAQLHVLTLTDGVVAQVGARSSVEQLDNQRAANQLAKTLPTPGSAAAAPSRGDVLTIVDPGGLTAGETSEHSTVIGDRRPVNLEKLISQNGPIARLLQARPDLTARVQQLLSAFATRTEQGVGTTIDQLTHDLASVRKLPLLANDFSAKQSLAAIAEKLTSSLFSSPMFDQPAQLANTLGARLEGLAQGLEAKLALASENASASARESDHARVGADAQTSTTSSADPKTASANKNANPAKSSTDVETEIDSSAAASRHSRSTGDRSDASVGADRITDRIADRGDQPGDGREVGAGRTLKDHPIDSDLKGSLLELKGRLESIAARQGNLNAAVNQAIERTDLMINQLIGQQLKNVDGMGQVMHVALPIDPRTGIDAARLQVFHRQRGSSADQGADDRLTVALYLDLSRLGSVAAVMTSVDHNMSVAFTVDNPRTEAWLKQGIEELRSALQGSGHSAVTVTVRQPPVRPSTEAVEPPEAVWEWFLGAPPPGGKPGGRLDSRA